MTDASSAARGAPVRHRAPLAAAVLALLLAAPAAAVVLPPGFAAVRTAHRLARPTDLALSPDGRIFVAEQIGRLRVIEGGKLLEQPFVTVPVDHENERGLLGVALHPDFPRTPYVYVYYTAVKHTLHNRLSRFTAAGNRAVGGSERVLLDLPETASDRHNGGALAFGPDGKLYVTVGDQQQRGAAQLLTSPLGKVLRLDPDGGIPSDNPFFASTTGVGRAIWALGLRNPFKLAFQPGTGRLLINDVGLRGWEEINEGAAGANYGWPLAEGPSGDPAFRDPVLAYTHGVTDDKGCAITGGTFYDPPRSVFPERFRGSYFFADFCGGWIRRLDTRDGDRPLPFALETAGPVELEVDADGNLHYLSYYQGELYRISYTGTGAPQIEVPPEDRRVAAGAAATFAVTAAGAAPLRYQWRRDGQPLPEATAASYTLPAATAGDDGARFSVVVSNDEGSVTSRGALLTVVPGSPPVAAIQSPLGGTLYAGGDTIDYGGAAQDAEDGTLPLSALVWRVDFHHAAHVHPVVPDTPGVAGGTLVVPTADHTEPDVWYRIHLRATDSTGLVGSTFVDVHPRTVRLDFATEPPGLRLSLDGSPRTAPFTETAVVGVTRTVAAATQVLDDVVYDLESWSDGGPAAHAFVTPESDATLVARFAPRLGERGLFATYFAGPAFTGGSLVRVDRHVSFNWGAGSPAPGVVPADGFTVRWTGLLEAAATGRHLLHVRSDDGARLWLDGELVIDDWGPHAARVATAEAQLEAGRRYSVRLEYQEVAGPAGVRLLWTPPGKRREVVPAARLLPGG
jgi:glucose/arabinose dehydrogenase